MCWQIMFITAGHDSLLLEAGGKSGEMYCTRGSQEVSAPSIGPQHLTVFGRSGAFPVGVGAAVQSLQNGRNYLRVPFPSTKLD